jgi:ABC-type multidrug transport system permease subunit
MNIPGRPTAAQQHQRGIGWILRQRNKKKIKERLNNKTIIYDKYESNSTEEYRNISEEISGDKGLIELPKQTDTKLDLEIVIIFLHFLVFYMDYLLGIHLQAGILFGIIGLFSFPVTFKLIGAILEIFLGLVIFAILALIFCTVIMYIANP